MSIKLIVKAGTYPNFVTELNQLPTTVQVDQSTGFKLFIGLGIAAFILLFFLGTVMFFVAAISTIILYFSRGFSWFFAPDTMTFKRTEVTITQFNLFKKQQSWTESYRNFEGVFLNQESEKNTQGQYVDYVTIELQHSDPEKTLPLYAKQQQEPNKDAYDQLKYYANIFNLPAFD